MKIDAAFNGIRIILNEVPDKIDSYKSDMLCLDIEKSASLIVNVATQCDLLLDRFMFIVWQKLSNSVTKKPRIYFPVFNDKNKFEKKMKEYGLENMEKDIPELFALIKEVQPFNRGRSWLSDQKNIASERHSDPTIVYQPKRDNSLWIFMPDAIGQRATASITKENGDVVFATIERYGIPDRDPPKFIIRSQSEALDFIESCLIETKNLLTCMIECFEKKL